MASIVDLFVGKATQRFWERLNSKQIIQQGRPAPAGSDAPIEPDQAYLNVRMTEVYLRTIRVLWRKYYPMLHGFVSYGSSEEHVIAGPGQLKELGESNLDRVVNLHQRLGGPIAYKGGEVTVLAGMYSVPGEDAAKALVQTVGNLASLPGVSLGAVPQITNLVKTSIESILSLDESKLELGVRDTFYNNNPLRAGYYVAMNAPQAEVSTKDLWLNDGRLLKGSDPVQAKPYSDHDYMVIEIERLASRSDWASLPGFEDIEKKFDEVMKDGAANADAKRARLAGIWPEFETFVSNSKQLTAPDKALILSSTANDLKKRLESGTNPFETRSWKGTETKRTDPRSFDFLDVADDPRTKLSTGANPFAEAVTN